MPDLTGPPRLRLGARPLSVVGRARMYVCGVTPYDTTHLGHAATFVWVDVADRVLRRLGVQRRGVPQRHRRGRRVRRRRSAPGAHYDRFAAVQQFHFERDMDALGVRRPTHEPRAHTFVPQVVELAAALLEVGAAYGRAGSVFFRGARRRRRGRAVARAGAAALAANGGRPDDPAKDDPLDQAVWQASDRRRAGVAAPVGPRPARLARRVHRDGAVDLRLRRSTCTPAAPTCASRTTPTRRRRPRRPPASRRSPEPGCTSAPCGSTARRWPSRPATWCSSRDLLAAPAARSCGHCCSTGRTRSPWDYTDAELERAGSAAGRAAHRRRPAARLRRGAGRGARRARRRPRRRRAPGTSPWRTAGRPPASSSASWPCSAPGGQPGGGRAGATPAAEEVARVRVELAAAAAGATPLAELDPTASDLTRVLPLLEQLARRSRAARAPTWRPSGRPLPGTRRARPERLGRGSPTTTSADAVPFGTGSAGRAVAERRVVLVEDVETSGVLRRLPRRRAAARGAGGALGADADARRRADGGVGGLLPGPRRRPTRRDLELVELYARQAAEIVERARLHAEAPLTGRAERRRAGQLRALADAALALSAADRSTSCSGWSPRRRAT